MILSEKEKKILTTEEIIDLISDLISGEALVILSDLTHSWSRGLLKAEKEEKKNDGNTNVEPD